MSDIGMSSAPRPSRGFDGPVAVATERPRGAIEMALTALDAMLNELEANAVSLTERINPILNQQGEKVGSNDGVNPETGVGVADAVNRSVSRIYSISNHLRQTRNRVEL